MEQPGLTFDQWAQAICSYVREAYPEACVKHKFDDVYRWTYGGRECQVHALSEDAAAFIVLHCTQRPAIARRPERVSIAQATQAGIARRIIGWFKEQSNEAYSGASS